MSIFFINNFIKKVKMFMIYEYILKFVFYIKCKKKVIIQTNKIYKEEYLKLRNFDDIKFIYLSKDKINWYNMLIDKHIFEMNFQKLVLDKQPLIEELFKKVYHPKNVKKLLLKYDYFL